MAQPIPQIVLVGPTGIPDNSVAPFLPRQQQQEGPRPVRPPVYVRGEERVGQVNPWVFMAGRNQDAEEVVKNVRQDNLRGNNNMAYIVENISAQNGLNVGLHRPKFVSPLTEYVLQTELTRGWKVPKFTKFVGDTSESIVEQIT